MSQKTNKNHKYDNMTTADPIPRKKSRKSSQNLQSNYENQTQFSQNSTPTSVYGDPSYQQINPQIYQNKQTINSQQISPYSIDSSNFIQQQNDISSSDSMAYPSQPNLIPNNLNQIYLTPIQNQNQNQNSESEDSDEEQVPEVSIEYDTVVNPQNTPSGPYGIPMPQEIPQNSSP